MNIYSQIGLVLLIGLMAKNGVLLVEFADQLRDRGYDIRAAIEHGASVRLRPVDDDDRLNRARRPAAHSWRAAPAPRRAQSIGWVVFGGLGLAAVFTLYLTPAIYLKLARFSSARAHEAERLHKELDTAGGIADDVVWNRCAGYGK